MSPVSKPWTQVPYDQGIGDQLKQCLDYMLVQINQMQGQANPPPGAGLQTFGPNIINPTTSQIVSAGSRMTSVATGIQVVMTTTTATFYWDGTNGSQPFKIYRDDNTIFGPFITGSGQTVVTGLVANTKYFFYPYFDETLQRIQFATVAGVAVGNPAIAFTTQNNLALQQQILRNRIPLANLLVSTGATTPNAGTITVKGGSGGGGAGGGGNGTQLP